MPGVLSDPQIRADVAGLFDQDYQLLRYIGARDEIFNDLGGAWQKIFKGLLTDLGRIAKSLSGVDLSGTATLEEISKILDDNKNRATIAEKLRKLQIKLNNESRSFNAVEATQGKALLSSTAQPPADSLVCVEGCIARGSAIWQYYPPAIVQLGSPDAWFMTDGPPSMIRQKTYGFGGKFLILDLEPGFESKFNGSMPFWPDIGWYPYIRITGYFRTPSTATRGLPALSVSLLEYRSPKGFLDASRDLAWKLENNRGKTDAENAVTMAYLAPLISKAARQPPTATIDELLPILKKLRVEIGAEMPQAISSFYGSLP